MAKISVIIPVYNVAQYLQSCIDSLLCQTLEDLELIFVNDASPDNSLDILRDNQRSHPDKNIVVIDSAVNRCIGGARNLGLQAATAPYIGYVDSDDFIAPDMYENLYHCITAENADAAFISAARVGPRDVFSLDTVWSLPTRQPMIYDSGHYKKFSGRELTDDDRLALISNLDGGGVWSGLYKKSVFLEHDISFPEHLRFEDNYWGPLLRCYLTKIACVEKIGYYYRYNPDSISKKRNVSFYDERIQIEHLLMEETRRRDLFDRFYPVWEYLYAERYAMNTTMAYITRFDEVPDEKIRRLQKDLRENFPHWRKNRFLNYKSPKELFRILVISLDPSSVLARCLYAAIKRRNRKQTQALLTMEAEKYPKQEEKQHEIL